MGSRAVGSRVAEPHFTKVGQCPAPEQALGGPQARTPQNKKNVMGSRNIGMMPTVEDWQQAAAAKAAGTGELAWAAGPWGNGAGNASMDRGVRRDGWWCCSWVLPVFIMAIAHGSWGCRGGHGWTDFLGLWRHGMSLVG